MTDISRPRGPQPPGGTAPVRRITGETARPTPTGELSQAAAGMKGLEAFFELPDWARGVVNMMAKTEVGRAAIGTVGNALNPVLGVLGQAMGAAMPEQQAPLRPA